MKSHSGSGLFHDAYNRLTRESVEWATHIVFMEHEHATHIRRYHCAYLRASVVVLDIPDDYDYMDPSLVWKL